jgi:hypothetical protein
VRPLLLLALIVPGASFAQSMTADTAVRVTFGGFIDTYYAWDFGRPPTLDRSFAGGALFTTQPTRHNEFNVNLAFVEARLDGPDLRGRLALQAGTSVQSNYAGEATLGIVSGPSLSRHIQEAVGGVRVAPELWVDAGVFFSHLGMESWISRDNPTYTRSLVAEYSPYYQSGAKVTWTATSRLVAQMIVVNGWQNISENNGAKGLGGRVDWTLGQTTVSYYNLFTPEAGSRLRTLNGVGLRALTGRVDVIGQVDVGTQAQSTGGQGTTSWWGATAVARLRANEVAAVTARLEGFHDSDQIVAQTGSSNGVANAPLRSLAASVGVDVTRLRALWRTELRGFLNRDAVFPGGGGSAGRQSGFLVTSLAMMF